MLADIRRTRTTEHVLTAQTPASPIRLHAATFQFTAPVSPKRQEAVSVSNSELTAIKKDLTKTVILATLAIAAELVLYWFERR